ITSKKAPFSKISTALPLSAVPWVRPESDGSSSASGASLSMRRRGSRWRLIDQMTTTVRSRAQPSTATMTVRTRSIISLHIILRVDAVLAEAQVGAGDRVGGAGSAHPDPELVDARHQEADAVRVRGVLDQELHHRDEVKDLRGIVERGVHRDDRVVGRGAREIDRHLDVRRLARVERRDLVEELLRRDAGQLGSRRI